MIFTDEELVKPALKSLQKKLYVLENDGGGFEFLGVKNGVVYIKLVGACDGCASSATTLKYLLERQLKIDICDEISLVNLSGGMKEFEAI